MRPRLSPESIPSLLGTKLPSLQDPGISSRPFLAPDDEPNQGSTSPKRPSPGPRSLSKRAPPPAEPLELALKNHAASTR